MLRVMLEYLHPWTNSAGFFIAAVRGGIRRPASMSSCSITIHIGGIHIEYLLRPGSTFAVFPNKPAARSRDQSPTAARIASITIGPGDTANLRWLNGYSPPRDLEGRRVAYNPTPARDRHGRHLVTVDGGDPDLVITVEQWYSRTANGRHPRR